GRSCGASSPPFFADPSSRPARIVAFARPNVSRVPSRRLRGCVPSSARAFASLAQNVTPSADATVSRNLGGEPTGQTQQRVRDDQARERLPGHEDEHVSAG